MTRTVEMPQAPPYTETNVKKLISKLISHTAKELVVIDNSPKALKPYSDIVGPTFIVDELNQAANWYVEYLSKYTDKAIVTLRVLELAELNKRPFGKVNTYNPCDWLQEMIWWYTSNEKKFKNNVIIGDHTWILDKYFHGLRMYTMQQAFNRVNPKGSFGTLVRVKKGEAINSDIWPRYIPFGLSEVMCRFQYGGKTRVINNLHGTNAYAESTVAIPLNDALIRSGLTYNGPVINAHINALRQWRKVDASFGVKLDAYKFGPTVPTSAYYSMVRWIGNRFGTKGYAACLPYIETWVCLPLRHVMPLLKPPTSGTATGQPLNNPLGTILGLAPSLELKRDGYNIGALGSVDDQLIMIHKGYDAKDIAQRYQEKAERYGVISDADEAEVSEDCVVLGKKVWSMKGLDRYPTALRFVGRILVCENDGKHNLFNTCVHVMSKFDEWHPVQFGLFVRVLSVLLHKVFKMHQRDLGIGAYGETRRELVTYMRDLWKRKCYAYATWTGKIGSIDVIEEMKYINRTIEDCYYGLESES